MTTKPKPDADLSGTPVDQTRHRSMIGSLMYLTSSRPDMVQAVCYCARYQARPTKKHLKEVKSIFRYLKGTINMGLWYPKDFGFELTAFSDADYVECLETRKSISRGIQFLGEKLVSWMSKKQDFNVYGRCRSSIAISCNPVHHSRTKHINVHYHYIKEQVKHGLQVQALLQPSHRQVVSLVFLQEEVVQALLLWTFLSRSLAASIGLYINSGSIYETPATLGVSHVLERMAFKSTFNRTHLRLVREVEAIGGNVTASASREQMGYTYDALKTYFPQMVELLVDCVRNQAFKDWEVNE
nr:mitochondrial-processing peptidase subunit alpha-like [Tanacetum cinerariifolium]